MGDTEEEEVLDEEDNDDAAADADVIDEDAELIVLDPTSVDSTSAKEKNKKSFQKKKKAPARFNKSVVQDAPSLSDSTTAGGTKKKRKKLRACSTVFTQFETFKFAKGYQPRIPSLKHVQDILINLYNRQTLLVPSYIHVREALEERGGLKAGMILITMKDPHQLDFAALNRTLCTNRLGIVRMPCVANARDKIVTNILNVRAPLFHFFLFLYFVVLCQVIDPVRPISDSSERFA